MTALNSHSIQATASHHSCIQSQLSALACWLLLAAQHTVPNSGIHGSPLYGPRAQRQETCYFYQRLSVALKRWLPAALMYIKYYLFFTCEQRLATAGVGEWRVATPDADGVQSSDSVLPHCLGGGAHW